jgi:hypothetical protein
MMRGIALFFFVCSLGYSAPPLQDVLRHAGKSLEVFWEQFSAINCTETVSQLKLAKGDKPAYRMESVYDYLVLMQAVDADVAVEESRVKIRSVGKTKDAPLLITNGFSTLLLIFHPSFQNSFEYSPPVEEELEGKEVLRVDFRHVRGAHSPSCLRLRGRDYPLDWRGSAWVEPASGRIVRIATELQSDMEDLGLLSLAADVRYQPVRFTDAAESFWLPASAVIDARTLRQHWRNIHRFTNYRHFTVKTNSKTEMPQ